MRVLEFEGWLIRTEDEAARNIDWITSAIALLRPYDGL
jgi:hypothetical protein